MEGEHVITYKHGFQVPSKFLLVYKIKLLYIKAKLTLTAPSLLIFGQFDNIRENGLLTYSHHFPSNPLIQTHY